MAKKMKKTARGYEDTHGTQKIRSVTSGKAGKTSLRPVRARGKKGKK